MSCDFNTKILNLILKMLTVLCTKLLLLHFALCCLLQRRFTSRMDKEGKLMPHCHEATTIVALLFACYNFFSHIAVLAERLAWKSVSKVTFL